MRAAPVLLLLSLVSALLLGALPASVSFTKLVDTNTAIPDGNGSFSSLILPAVSAGALVFNGSGSGGQEGIYVADGGLRTVADRNTAIPSGTGTFSDLASNAAISGDRVAFVGAGSGGQLGLYLDDGSSLGVVADTTTTVPGGSATFTSFGTPALSGSALVFVGFDSGGSQALYRYDGTLSVVADQSTAIPDGTGSFTAFTNPAFDNGRIAFRGAGSSGQLGIYEVAGSLRRVADLSTTLPAGTGSFDGFDLPAGGDARIAFEGTGSGGQSGIYLFEGSALDVVADETSAVPGATGTFDFFGFPTVSATAVAFEATGGSRDGIYIDLGDGLEVLVDETDMLDGQSIFGFGLGREGIDGPTLGFAVAFVGGGSAIYRVDLPQPVPLPAAGVVLLGAALATLGARRLHRDSRSR